MKNEDFNSFDIKYKEHKDGFIASAKQMQKFSAFGENQEVAKENLKQIWMFIVETYIEKNIIISEQLKAW